MKLHVQVDEELYEVTVEARQDGWRRHFVIRLEKDQRVSEKRFDLLSGLDREFVVSLEGSIEKFVLSKAGSEHLVHWRGRSFRTRVWDARDRLDANRDLPGADGAVVVRAQMPGKVVRRLYDPGASVERGEGILVVEAMKMQNEVKSPRSGTLLRCDLEPGDHVEMGAVLFEVE